MEIESYEIEGLKMIGNELKYKNTGNELKKEN
jgi:hypothetical protein